MGSRSRRHPVLDLANRGELGAEGQQVTESVDEAGVGELVALAPALLGGDDEAAAAQAGKVVRHVRLRQSQVVGKLGRVVRALEQAQQNLATVRIGQGTPDPVQRLDRQLGTHNRISTADAVVQSNLY